jgi:diguanylate cyclase
MPKAGAKMMRAQLLRDWLASYLGNPVQPICLLLIGIKDLKQINDRYGRVVGDLVIRKTAAKIRQFAAAQYADPVTITRLPGREFALVVNGDRSAKQIESDAKKLLESLSVDMGDANPVHISVRIGIALSEPRESGTELLHRAGLALAQAYGRKGKRLAFSDYKAASGASLSAALDADLRKAIAARQITIMLQPQFVVINGQLSGAEALARWHHPEHGEIGAARLFAAADRCDLREELSHLIQEEAIAIASRWPAALDGLRLSVNLGAGELGEGYSERILAVLAKTGFPTDRLTLELTEESLVRDIDSAAVQLEKLRATGIRIAVDDFGTGYSSLAYLKTLPLDYLKIDKGMTPDLGGTGKDRIVLRAIIAMGKALGLGIIAEGVEHEAELEMLKAEDCDFFQGYLCSPALLPADFEAFAMRSN